MKRGYTPKWIHPKKMITQFSEVFKDIDVKKRVSEIYCSSSWQSLLRKRFASTQSPRVYPSPSKKRSQNKNDCSGSLKHLYLLMPSWRHGVFSPVNGSGKGDNITSMFSSTRPTSLTVGKQSWHLSLFATVPYLSSGSSMKIKRSETQPTKIIIPSLPV